MLYKVDLGKSVQGRGNRGGALGATCPHNFEAVGAPPPTLDCHCRSFFFIHVNLGLSQKIVDQIRGVFSFE